MNQVHASLERLHKLYPKLIDLKLERLLRLLGALGDPHLRLPPVIPDTEPTVNAPFAPDHGVLEIVSFIYA